MAVKIGSNIASLRAQAQLGRATTELSSVYERLSSGMRINRAADDAAGLAIASQLNSDRRVFNQGIRNFNDGLSLLNIADGAIEQLSTVVLRLKELAEQSANGTYSKAQRAAIDKEAQALSKEYSRIVHSTKLNGMYLLDGSLGAGISLQGGYGTDGSIQSGVGGAIGTGAFAALTANTSNLGEILDLETGDVNGDGYLDAVVVSDSFGARGVSIFLGSSSGSLTLHREYSLSAGSTPNSLALADINNDGVLDIVTGGSVTANVLLGSGNGNFGPATTLSITGATQDIALKDVNGDGILDLISAGTAVGGIVGIRLGSGNGTFGSMLTYSMETGQTEAVELMDLNNDGILDLITAGAGAGTGRMTVRLGAGDGTFKSSVSYQTDGALANDVKLGDLNGDGVLDIVSGVVNGASSYLNVRLGNGDGTFGSSTSYLTYAGTTNSISIGDVNGDGFLDIVSAGRDGVIAGTSSVHLGGGNGTFQTSVTYAQGANRMNVVVLGDINGDGVFDLVAGGYGSSSAFGALNVRFGVTESGSAPLLPFSLETMADSRQALSIFDQKIQQLAQQRGQIGSFQSRINVGINTLQSAAENYAAAESRIRDVDIAQESANLVRLQILQKAAAAVLAQANIQPQLAIKLLNG